MESLVTDTLFHWTIVAFVVTLVCHVLYIGITFWRNLKEWKTLKPIWLATLVVFFGVWLVLASCVCPCQARAACPQPRISLPLGLESFDLSPQSHCPGTHQLFK